jgi:hypothetical protein
MQPSATSYADLPALPRMRDEMPTIPCDLEEYAWLQTGPESWSAFGTVDDELDIDQASFGAGEMIGVRTSDVPKVMISDDQRFEQKLDHREGFVLALLDQCDDVQTLLDIAGLPEGETLAILCELCARRIVSLESA